MRFLTEGECRAWAETEQLDANGHPTLAGPERIHHREGGLGPPYFTARRLAGSVRPWRRCLLWVHPLDFADSGNQHLYYRLRQSYGETRLIEETPGHLFLDYEEADLVSFLQLAIEGRWDAFVLTEYDYGRLFLSHGGNFEASFSGPQGLADFLSLSGGWGPGTASGK